LRGNKPGTEVFVAVVAVEVFEADNWEDMLLIFISKTSLKFWGITYNASK